MATRIFDVVTIVHAVKTAEVFLGKDRVWSSTNPDQQQFLRWLKEYAKDVMEMKDIKAKASKSVVELNAFLKENGFDIQLEAFRDPEGFGVVSILDRLVNWLTTGEDRTVRVDGKTYPAFRLTEGVEFWNTSDSPNPIVKIQTKSGDTVCLTFGDQELEGVELAKKILHIVQAEKIPNWDSYDGVIIPDVMIDMKPSLDWLLGMSTRDEKDQTWFISQALQQAKFAMNKLGARIKVATAIAMSRGLPPEPKPDLIFDRPFYLWIEGREGSKLPMAMIYVDTDTWKKADLNAL